MRFVKVLVCLVYLWGIVWNVLMMLIEEITLVVLVKKGILKMKKRFVKVV